MKTQTYEADERFRVRTARFLLAFTFVTGVESLRLAGAGGWSMVLGVLAILCLAVPAAAVALCMAGARPQAMPMPAAPPVEEPLVRLVKWPASA